MSLEEQGARLFSSSLIRRLVLRLYNLFDLNWAEKNTETPENSANPEPVFIYCRKSFFEK